MSISESGAFHSCQRQPIDSLSPQEKAQEDDQKYKEGKFILERTLLIEVAA